MRKSFTEDVIDCTLIVALLILVILAIIFLFADEIPKEIHTSIKHLPGYYEYQQFAENNNDQ